MAVPGQAGLLDPAGGHLQRGEQRGGAVADVVVGLLLRHPRQDRQDRRGPVQGLDLRFLIDAEHHGLLRRVQIQPDHVADLRVELGVGGELERLDPPRLQLPLAPDPRHRGERDPQLGAQQPGRPVRHPQMGRRPAVVGQGGHHDVDLVDLRRPPAARLIVQGGDPAGVVAGPPVHHRRPRRPGPPRDLRVRQPLGGQQHDPRPLRQPGPDRARPHHPLQPRTITLTQDQRRSNRHDSLSRTSNRKQSYDTRH